MSSLFWMLPLWMAGCAKEPKGLPAHEQSTDKDFEDFKDGRELWFEMTASQGDIRPSAEFPHVFAVIMDWRIKDRQTLVAAAADGTSSLYISPGPKVLGGYSAKEKAIAVISEAENILELARKVSEHPLPPPGEVRFYIRTHSGLYMISDTARGLLNNQGMTLRLFVAANKVMTVHLDTIDEWARKTPPLSRE